MKLHIQAEGEEREVLLPETHVVYVEARTYDGQPVPNVIITAPVGRGVTLTSFVVDRPMDGLLRVFLDAMTWGNQHNGDMRGFYAAMAPLAVPLPVPDPPAPAPPPVVDAGLSAANTRIVAYANTRRIGPPRAGTFQIGPGWYGRNYEGGVDATGLCIVVDSPRGTHLVRNGFFANYTERSTPKRSELGPPLEDEQGTGPGAAEQRFANGKLKWNVVSGVWAEMA